MIGDTASIHSCVPLSALLLRLPGTIVPTLPAACNRLPLFSVILDLHWVAGQANKSIAAAHFLIDSPHFYAVECLRGKTKEREQNTRQFCPGVSEGYRRSREADFSISNRQAFK